MDEDECEGMRKEGKVKSRITKESGTNSETEQRKGKCSELAERICPWKPVGFIIVQHRLIRALRFQQGPEQAEALAGI